ncbi:MAG: sigma-70 family RNA polymerase sigma factor [Oscillospiraceae bacterium]|nr:sigma-70 family RNA polymerase sigma factor [Oscillospiraceae bacterium]
MLYCSALALIKDDSDRELVQRIYDRYERMMYSMALSILRDPADAEDAVQTAFVRIIDHLQIILEKGCHNHKAYFVIIAKHVALNMLHKRNNHPVEDIDEHYELSDDVSVETAVLSRLGEEEIARAVNSLSDTDRDIMYLNLYEGMQAKEIAELAGMKPNTVSVRIRRAKKKLADILRERGINYE